MIHADHVNLIKDGIPRPGGVWADLGSGGGAFTLALAELIGPTGEIFSVDKNGRSLRQQAHTLGQRFPQISVTYLKKDFRKPLEVPPLDGIIMANSLHFVRHKAATLRHIRGYLRPGGRLIIVEYSLDRGNIWVPHPFSFSTWEMLARTAGFTETRLLATRPSRTFGEIYAALSIH